MDLKNHFFLTLAAFFFLGLIIARPGSFVSNTNEERDCRLIKGKMDCFYKHNEYRMNDSRQSVNYQIVEGKD